MRAMGIAAVVVLTLGQPAADPYAGVWTATHNGRTYARLELKVSAQGRLEGEMRIAHDIQVDAQGVVSMVSEDMQDAAAILDVHLTETVLAFSRKDGDDTDRFEMRLRGRDAAELAMVLSDADRQELTRDGVAIPKPFPLTRQSR